MVRMSDLVRGGGAPPAAPRPAPPAGTPRPPAAAPAEPAPPPAAAAEPAAATPDTAEGAAPGLAEAAAAPGIDSRDADDAEALFVELRATLGGVREAVKTAGPLPWARLEAVVDRTLASLERAGELFWVANRPALPAGEDDLVFHHARVSVLAMRLGLTLGLGRPRLLDIGLAGALIDIGLWQLPAAMLRRLDGLSLDEQAQFKAHPRAGADIVRRWAPVGSSVPDLVLQHHEREQGQGFPQRLTGESIRLEAKILGLVDTYTGLTAPASLRPGVRPHEAIRQIVRSRHEAFPPALIKALLTEISVFPPGTLVRLNTGEVGCVVAVNRHHPLRPRLSMHDARGGNPGAPKVLDLSEMPFLYITGPVSEDAR